MNERSAVNKNSGLCVITRVATKATNKSSSHQQPEPASCRAVVGGGGGGGEGGIR